MDSAQARRRWFGIFFLILASGMLIWGQTLLKPYLKDVNFLFYWLFCFLFTGLAILTALLDVRALRRKTLEDQRKLIHRTMEEVAGENDLPKPKSQSSIDEPGPNKG